MIRRPKSRSIGRVAAMLLLTSATLLIPDSPVGAGVGGAESGTVKIIVTEETRVIDVDDVTVLIRWVGQGYDLGPAPTDSEIFKSLAAARSGTARALPSGCVVAKEHTTERVENDVSETAEYSQELDTGDWVYGEDFTGDPNDPFSWIAFGNEDIDISLVLVETITRIHHITETRTHQILDPDGACARTAAAVTPGNPGAAGAVTAAAGSATGSGPAAAATPAAPATPVGERPSYTG